MNPAPQPSAKPAAPETHVSIYLIEIAGEVFPLRGFQHESQQSFGKKRQFARFPSMCAFSHRENSRVNPAQKPFCCRLLSFSASIPLCVNR